MFDLSIIIPVFNGEKFIKKCLDNILSIKCNKEIIVINDCSTDSSLKILKEYSDKINLISLNENKGVSYARNLGIKEAKGEYISFLDVDDEIEKDMYPKMLKKISSSYSDVCICNYDEYHLDSKKVIKSKHKLEFESLENSEIIHAFLMDKISPYVWDKMFKTELIKNIKFNEEIKISEDALFCLETLYYAKKLTCVNEYLYHYVQQNMSASHTLNEKLLDFLKITNNIESKIKLDLESKFNKQFIFFNNQMIIRGVNAISFSTNKKNKKQAKQFLKKYCTKENIKNILKCKFVSKAFKLEFWIIKLFGLNVHLMCTPFYMKYRNNSRKSED